ncbi:MAG: AAA family ATPase [Bdellovibrionales bacterium]|nr:AAA family ATPase [Bdellovibrionales bacterium]
MQTPTAPPVPRERIVDTLACYVWSGVSVILIGPPGIGKSSTAKAIAGSFGWKYSRKGIPGMTDPVLFMGLPGQNEQNTLLKPFPWLQVLIDETAQRRRNVLLLDDIGESSRTIQSFLLDVLGERVIGDHPLLLTSMIGTANPIGGGLQVTPSMANRVGHLHFSVTTKEQAGLMIGDYPNPEIPKFDPNWEDRLPMARRLVAGFLQTTNDFNAPDLDGAEAQRIVGAYPSPRTWEYAARLLAAVDASSLKDRRADETRKLALKSVVGDAAANAFFNFLRYPDMPKPEDALRNPHGITDRKELFAPDKPDRGYIFLNAMTRYAIQAGTVDAWKNAWCVLGIFAKKECATLCAAHALVLFKRRPEGAPQSLPEMEAFRDLLPSAEEA